MRRFSMLLSLVFLSLAPFLAARPVVWNDATVEKFGKFVEQRLRVDHIPGMSIAFIQGDYIWADGYGFADIENRVPAKAETMYRLASVTKPMTAVAILQLMEQGKLQLADEARKYVPYFPEKKWPVTIGPLLGHLGGISHYRNYDKEGHFKFHKNTREAIAVFEDFDLVAEPGSKYQYSSYGYNLLGAVIEGASGKSYGQYMREKVWNPAGMATIVMDDPQKIIPNRVSGYILKDGQWQNSEFVDISSRFAAGGTRATVLDMVRFAKAVSAGILLKKETVRKMWTPMVKKDGRQTGYGMGWAISYSGGRFLAHHSGGQAETRTLLWSFPALDLHLAAACNLEGGSRAPYLQKLFELLNGELLENRVYAKNESDRILLDTLQKIFESGLAFYIFRQEVPDGDVGKAFAYLNKWLNPKALAMKTEELEQHLKDGLHPVSGNAWLLAGAYMAQQLAETNGVSALKEYYVKGMPVFFSDYLKIQINQEYRISRAIGGRINTLADEWKQTNEAVIRNLALEGFPDLKKAYEIFEEHFDGKSVYPDYSERLSDVIVQAALGDKRKRSLNAAAMAAKFYSKDMNVHISFALAEICAGHEAQASNILRSVKRIDHKRVINPLRLNSMAYDLKNKGFFKQGLSLLKVAVFLFPKNADLHDSLGEFYFQQGNRVKAEEFYRKALELEPNSENAKRMLEKIKSGTAGN